MDPFVLDHQLQNRVGQAMAGCGHALLMRGRPGGGV